MEGWRGSRYVSNTLCVCACVCMCVYVLIVFHFWPCFLYPLVPATMMKAGIRAREYLARFTPEQWNQKQDTKRTTQDSLDVVGW